MEIKSIKGLTKNHLATTYAELILSNPSDDEVIRINNLILTRFSNRGLADIKDRAWKIVEWVRSKSN
jgi:hypothetical protein